VNDAHPYTQISVAAAVPALGWLLPAPGGTAAMLAIAALLPASGASHGRRLAAALAAAAPFWVFLFLLHAPADAVILGLRLTTLIATGAWLSAVLRPGPLTEALVARGWPARVAFVVAGTLSAVPLVRASARRLVEAQRCRGLRVRGGLGVRLRALHALVLPLTLAALHDLDERTLALETRGLGTTARRTALDPPIDTPVQVAARWTLLGACILALGSRLTWHG